MTAPDGLFVSDEVERLRERGASTRARASDLGLATLVDLLRLRAAEQPSSVAFRHLGARDEVDSIRTYADLDREARAIAAVLARTTAPGDRALLLYPSGLEFIGAFFGCLYAGVIAVPAHVPLRTRELARLRAIQESARPKATLGTSAVLAGLESELGDAVAFATDAPLEDAELRSLPLDRSSLAFLQYTSGSTGLAKGVMVSHGNLLANERMIELGFGHDASSTIVGWLPHFHDMGLIGNILQALHLGTDAVLMSPSSFLRDPHKWLRAISKYRAHSSGAPNFGYKLCVTRKGNFEGLDLSSWKVAYSGSEPIQPDTLDAFARKFEPYGFRRESLYPCYGLAEATLFVSGVGKGNGHTVTEHAGRPRVGCGRPWGDEDVRIVDPTTREPCTEGEIWVSGDHVAMGYWNLPVETEETFGAELDGRRYLRTGDVGFFAGGELHVSGRLKDLVIVRGQNYYPQDIEATVEASHPAVRLGGVAAFPIFGDGEERLGVIAEVMPEAVAREPLAVCDLIREAVTVEHSVRASLVVLVPPGSVLKTSSGKVQRRETRAAFLDGRLRVVEKSEMETPG